MIRKLSLFILASILFTFVSGPLATAQQEQFKPLSPAQKKKLTKFCPPINMLHKDTEGRWVGPNGWASFRSSPFVKKIGYFLGAQFQGAASVGEIICLYRGLDQQSFPVVLNRGNLAIRPEGKHWKLDPSKTYIICTRPSTTDCGFIPRVDVMKLNRTNVYDKLKKLK
jgi:hypothetical protein